MEKYNSNLSVSKKYSRAIKLAKSLNVDEINEGIELLKEIQDYKDADKLLFFFEKRLAFVLDNNIDAAKMLEYKPLRKKEKVKKTLIKISIVLVSIVLCIFAFFIIVEADYNNAKEKLLNDKYSNAINKFDRIEWYKDSKELRNLAIDIKTIQLGFENIKTYKWFLPLTKDVIKIKVDYIYNGNCIESRKYNNPIEYEKICDNLDIEINDYEDLFYSLESFDLIDLENKYIEATVKVIVDLKTFYVFYDLDGGGINDGTVAVVSGNGYVATQTAFTYNDSITISEPYKAGFKFKGWIVNKEGEAVSSFTIPEGTAQNYYLTAVWEKE